MPDTALTRREVVVRGALVAAASALPWPELVEAARRRKRRRRGSPFDCLAPGDRFAPAGTIPDCTLVSYSPDGQHIACQTPRGVEVRPRGAAAGTVIAPPGFAISRRPWHPDGQTLLVTGISNAAGDSVTPPTSEPALFAVKADGSGLTRLLPEIGGTPRAAVFSPDGSKLAYTMLDRFVHRMVMADFAVSDSTAANPHALLPFDPRNEDKAQEMSRGLAWYETYGFAPDGQSLLFLSDRLSGMLNVGPQRLDLQSGKVTRLTRDDGFTEGAVIEPGGRTMFYGSTRAREPGFLTVFTGPSIPTFLGFVAAQTLHDGLAALAPVGNGDVLAAQAASGLQARLVGRREVIGARVSRVAAGNGRVDVCAISPDGRELAIAVTAAGTTTMVLMRRQAAAPPVPVGPSSIPPTAAPIQPVARRPAPSPGPSPGLPLPLLSPPPPSTARQPRVAEEEPVIERTLKGRYEGSVALRFEGNLTKGSFTANFDAFSDDGAAGYQGLVSFSVDGDSFGHRADVRRVRGEERERGFYKAALDVGGGAVAGSVSGFAPRRGNLAATAGGSSLVPRGKWKAGRREPSGVVGVGPCTPAGKRRRRKSARKKARKGR